MIEEILDKARWFYIPYKPYKSFYHLIIENDVDDWTFYYLEDISSAGQIADVSGIGDMSFFSDAEPQKEDKKPEKAKYDIPIPDGYSEIRKYEVFRLMEKELYQKPIVDREISGCGIVRKVHGNLGAMIREFQKVLK